MTLELKRCKPGEYNFFGVSTEPYTLGGVKEITSHTEYGTGRFAITIFDRRVLITKCFDYVKDPDSGKYFVKNGEWVGGNI